MRSTIRRMIICLGCLIPVGMLEFACAQSITALPPATQLINAGKDLVAANGCATCHSAPGGAAFDGSASAPALVNDSNKGLGAWSSDDIAIYLKTGHNRFADAGGAMAGIITRSTSKLTNAQARAIGVYLKSLSAPARPAPAPIAVSDPAMITGMHIYADECASCHTDQGAGSPELIPDLRASPVVAESSPRSIINIVLNGAQSVGTPSARAAAMPGFGYLLNDQEVADVLTYIRNSWGNAASAVSPGLVGKAR